MIGAAFMNVPVVDEFGEPLPIAVENVVERSIVPVATFGEAIDMIDAFALELMFTADENPENLNYRGVVLVEVADDGETILASAGRNLL